MTLSFLSTALLLVNGWLGGELAYRYGLGAIQDDSPEVEQFHTPDAQRAAHTPIGRY